MPVELFPEYGGKKLGILNLFVSFKDDYATGITNHVGMSAFHKYLFFQLAPRLMTFNLIEKVKVSGAKYEKIQTSKLGFEFLKMVELFLLSKGKSENDSEQPDSSHIDIGNESTETSDVIEKSTTPKKPAKRPRKSVPVV